MPYKRCKPIKNERARTAWGKQRPRCYACGGTFGLENHHVVKFKRSDEPTNLFRACVCCHGSIEGGNMIVKGERLPRLTFGMVLWLKRRHDPDEYDLDRLRELYRQELPDEEQPPAYYLEKLRASGFTAGWLIVQKASGEVESYEAINHNPKLVSSQAQSGNAGKAESADRPGP